METDNTNEIQKVKRVAQANRKRLLLFSVRPQSPRGARFNAQGYVAWDEPSETRNVTHYNVYAGSDTTLYRRYPVGMTVMNDLQPNTGPIWVSSWNEESGQESHKIKATAVGSATGTTGIPGTTTTAAGVAPVVTSFAASNERASSDRTSEMFRLKASWTLPTDVSNYLGVRILGKLSGDASWTILGTAGATDTALNAPWLPVPATNQTWTLDAVSINRDGVLNVINGSTPTTTTTVTAGVGGIDMRTATSGTYSNINFRINPSTGLFEVTGVDVAQAFNYDSSQFDVGSGAFKVKALVASVINSGTLKVGGVGGMVGQVSVVDSGGTTQIGWIGWDGGAYRGGWFKNLYVGGNDPSTAMFTVVGTTVNLHGCDVKMGRYHDSTLGADFDSNLFVNNASGMVGWVGTQGGIYGGWFKNLWVGGTGVGDALLAATGGGVTMTNVPLTLLSGLYKTEFNVLTGLYGGGVASMIARSYNVFGTSYAAPENATEIRDTGVYIDGRIGGTAGLGPYPGIQMYNSGSANHLYMYGLSISGFPQVYAHLESSGWPGNFGKLHLGDGTTEKITLNGANGNTYFTGALCTPNYSSASAPSAAPFVKIPVYSSDGGTLLGYLPIYASGTI